MQDWIKRSLLEEQQKPFSRSTRNAVILAAAGSGKTRTLVHLVANDIAKGIPPSDIIVFTFTTKAAEELLARIHFLATEHFPEINLNGMYIGTIHAWCLKHLTEQSDYYNFTPIDELHTDALISRLYDFLKLTETYGLQYPRAIGRFIDDVEIFFNENLTDEQVPIIIASSIEKFIKVLRDNHLMPFGSMISYTIEHLKVNGPVPNLQALYVDEYQDVNPAQVALIKAMLPKEGKVVVVGDDLQCIYNWRGSDVTRIIYFTREFDDASVYRLSENHRSRPNIVSLGNAISSYVKLRDPDKVMKPRRADQNSATVHWISLESEQEQANTIVDIIKHFMTNGVPLNRIAILMRSVVSSGRQLIETLSANDIPTYCPVLSRGAQFINEFLLPVFNWLRSEHLEPRNEIEEEEAEKAANKLWLIVRSWVERDDAELIFWNALNQWHDVISGELDNAYNVRSQLYNFLDACNIHIAPDEDNLMIGIGIASQIIRSVEEIHRRRLQEQSRRTPRGIMSEVYHAILRKQNEFGESMPIDTKVHGVLITTVHQSKGLEWPVVIIPTLINRRFPVSQRKHSTSYPDHIAARYGTSVDDERRLFYVAAMRAREHLFLLEPLRNTPNQRSVFLREQEEKGVIKPKSMPGPDSPIWRINPTDIKESDPPPIRIGLSDLLIYVECPYQFGLRRVVAVQPSVGDELGFGLGLHELIQRRYEAKKPWSHRELNEQVKKHINLPYMSEMAENQSRNAIEKRLAILDQLGVFNSMVETELPIEILIGQGIVHGIIDSVILNPDGTVSIRDWKSNIHDEFMTRYERQIQFYVHAIQAQGRRVKQADIVDVAASSEQKKLVIRSIDIRDTTLSQLIQTLKDSLNGIAEGKFISKPSRLSCKACDMNRLCSERIAL